MRSRKENSISEKEVAEFLLSNPDFLSNNPEVLNNIQIIHESGAAVSLIQKQVELLRANYNETNTNLIRFLQIAQSNEKIFKKTKDLVLKILDSSNITELVEIIEKTFKESFEASQSRVLFFNEINLALPRGRVKKPNQATQMLGSLMKPHQIYCGEINEKVSEFIFDKKTKVQEVVLAPLKSNTSAGLLVLGSDVRGKYDNSKDTLFLDFISEVVSKVVDRLDA
tara:strand:- start:4778 stop:5452 length:675 start_codon:yes stop_codon:yes gene_type:complete